MTGKCTARASSEPWPRARPTRIDGTSGACSPGWSAKPRNGSRPSWTGPASSFPDRRRAYSGAKPMRRLSRVPWRDVMEGFRRELERFVTEFERAEALKSSSREVDDLLRHITNHERALLEFVTRELEDRSEHS